MRTRQEYIDIIKRKSSYIKETFGVKTLRLFGSVARNQQHESSDVDLCVEMPITFDSVMGLQIYLEDELACNVDLICMWSHMNAYLKQQIDKDGIYIIR